MYFAASCPSAIGVLYLFGCSLDPVNQIDFYTPLMECVVNNCVDGVRMLLSLNADTTQTSYKEQSVFELAFTNEMNDLLLEHDKKTVKQKRERNYYSF